MKTTFWLLAASFWLVLSALAQVQETSSFAIVERGDHHRLWQSVTTETDAKGAIHYRTNRYTELETGMHYQKDGQWLEASEEIEITAQGAVARHGRHQVIFSDNCNSPVAIDMSTPDGKRLQSRVLGLAYYDSGSGKMVWIAEIKDSVGQVLPPNQVIYIDAFTGFKAHLRYTYTKAGFEQDVILRERPPTPGKFGLNPATTRLQVMTEFLNPPAPRVQRKQLDDETDEQLDFGDMIMGLGKAFSLLGGSQTSIPVRKGWGNLNGRVFLVEEVGYPMIEPLLRTLPAPQASLKTSPKGKLYSASSQRRLPPVQVAKKRVTRPMKLASASLTGHGVVLDYTAMSSVTNYTFQGDTTYYVSGIVNLSGTNTIFEGGTVIKYSPTNTPKLNITSPINWQGSMYRPVVMTARDDHTVGEKIGSASVSGYYADTALNIDAVTAGTNAILQNLRISYANTAIALSGSAGHVVSHAQLVNCAAGIAPTNTTFSLRNALLYNVLTNFNGSSSTGRCEHLTVDTATQMNNNSAITLTMTNSLLVAVANTGTYTSNTVSTGTSAAFQTLGAGGHYLANDTYRNIGTANINTSLASDLQKLTTYPPIELANDFTVNTTLAPQAGRDTANYDLGFHYSPLDFVVSGRALTNSTLTLANGVALGTYGSSSGHGLYVRQGGRIVSEGGPTNLNQIVRYNTVQEQAGTNWSSDSVATSVKIANDGGTLPTGVFRFTGWSLLSGNGYHFYADSPGVTTPISFRDCQFGPGALAATQCSAALTNCLFERVTVNLNDGGDNFDSYACNNLFRGGSLTLSRSASGVWQFKDNLFDQVTISQSGTISHDYNGYVTNCNRLSPDGANDRVLTNSPTYVTSYLGNYYYPTNDGMLSQLIDAGSRYATNAGLYHFTVTADQVKEMNSAVDIGFHYVATDSSGVPIDTDGDGLPDYFEDRNGNGVYDTGDLASYLLSDTDGDGVSDYLEYVQGCNPLVAGATGDAHGDINLRVYTPLK